MKNYQITLVLLCVATLAFTSSSQAQTLKRTTTKTDKFDFGAGGTVSIVGAPQGAIRIIGSNRNEIEITAEIELQAGSEADLAKLAEVTGFITEETILRTGITTLGTHNKLGDKKVWKKFPKNLLNLPFRIDYTVSVPRFCDLEIDGGRGELSISGVDGSIRVNFLETAAKVETLGGAFNATFGSGTADISLGVRGWRGRTAIIQMSTGDLIVRLPLNLSADLDAAVLHNGLLESTFPDLKPRDRKVPFTDRSIIAKAGVGGATLKLVVGDGNLKLLPIARP